MNKVLTVLLMLGVLLPSQVWAESDAEWMRKVTAGLSTSGGNTEKGSLSAEFLMKRERDDDETQLRWTGYLGTSDSKLDSKKFYGLLRHDEKFGEDRTWYQFGKLEGMQDVFADINYRITPGYGVGRWLYDEDDFKLKLETALGYQYTDYRSASKKDEGEVVLIPRLYLEKQLLDNLRLVEDLTLYPSLEGGPFRLRNETSLVSKISDDMSWKVSYIDDYNSDPSPGTKKNDWIVTAGVDYSF